MPTDGAKTQIEWNWYGVPLTAAIDKAMNTRLKAVGALGKRAAVIKISTPFRGAGEERRYQPKRTGAASEPGDPPKRDIGRLAQSVIWTHNASAMTVVIGTAVNYGFWLETGTTKMEARPWLVPMLNEMWQQFKAILTAPIPDGQLPQGNPKLKGA
jgi:hypothetical protein